MAEESKVGGGEIGYLSREKMASWFSESVIEDAQNLLCLDGEHGVNINFLAIPVGPKDSVAIQFQAREMGESMKPKKGVNFHKLRIQRVGATQIPAGTLKTVGEQGCLVGEDDPVIVVNGQRLAFCHREKVMVSEELTELPTGNGDEVVSVPLYVPMVHREGKLNYVVLATRFPKTDIATERSATIDFPKGDLDPSQGRLRMTRSPAGKSQDGVKSGEVVSKRSLKARTGLLEFEKGDIPEKYLPFRDKFLGELMKGMVVHGHDGAYARQALQNYDSWAQKVNATHEYDDCVRVGRSVLAMISRFSMSRLESLQTQQKQAVDSWNVSRDEMQYANAEACEQVMRYKFPI